MKFFGLLASELFCLYPVSTTNWGFPISWNARSFFFFFRKWKVCQGSETKRFIVSGIPSGDSPNLPTSFMYLISCNDWGLAKQYAGPALGTFVQSLQRFRPCTFRTTLSKRPKIDTVRLMKGKGLLTTLIH